MKSYLGLLCIGKNYFEAVHAMIDDDFFKETLGIGHVPSPDRLRLRMDRRANDYLPFIEQASIDFFIV